MGIPDQTNEGQDLDSSPIHILRWKAKIQRSSGYRRGTMVHQTSQALYVASSFINHLTRQMSCRWLSALVSTKRLPHQVLGRQNGSSRTERQPGDNNVRVKEREGALRHMGGSNLEVQSREEKGESWKRTGSYACGVTAGGAVDDRNGNLGLNVYKASTKGIPYKH